VSDPGRPIGEEELHAWIDGQLDADRQPAVLHYLQDHPEIDRQVATWREHRQELRAAFASLAADPIPPRLGLERLIQQRLASRRMAWRMVATALLAFGLGGASGWFLHTGLQAPGDAAITLLAQSAVSNHIVYTADRRRPTELGAQQRDDLAHWVSNRLNHQVEPPDLSAAGFSYLGGRLAATADGPAGLFMYDGPQSVRLTVFVLPLKAASEIPIRHIDFAHVDGCAWIDKGVGYTVVGKLPPPELRRIAERVRQQLSGTI
jgi:anti-sigma factor RsiW